VQWTRPAHGRHTDDGFTLIEIILAMFLTVVVMTALLGVLVSSLKSVTQARQRQTATALATQSLERLRALPYDSVTGSAAAAYPKSVGLQYVTNSPTPDTFAPTAVLPGVSETLVVNEYSGKRVSDPSTTVDGVVYTVQTYVTKPATATSQQAYNLTALVSWTSSVFPTTRTTAERSTEYSPSGCLSTAQRPFAAPCQAYFTSQAGLSAAGFSVTNVDDSKQDIEGFTGHLVELSLPALSANLQIEQTASGSANGTTSGARAVAGTESGTGAVPAAVSIDSDPSSTPLQDKTAGPVSQSSTTVSLTGTGTDTGGTLSAKPTSSDSAWSAAAIQAGTSTCIDGSQTSPGLMTGPGTQLRPCAAASVNQGSGGFITYASPTGVQVPVLSLAQPTFTSRAVAANLGGTSSGACATAAAWPSAPACVHSGAFRNLGDLVVGAPSAAALSTVPAATNGLFTVVGLQETAVAESGLGAHSPTYTRQGTLTYWSSLGYQSVTLATYPGGTLTVPQVVTTYPDGLVVTAQGTITVSAPPALTSTGTDCLATACVAQINAAGWLRAQMTFTVTTSAGTISSFVLVSDVGGLVAQSTYKAAPLA
jgi:Tfp pilus assembly protein PilV